MGLGVNNAFGTKDRDSQYSSSVCTFYLLHFCPHLHLWVLFLHPFSTTLLQFFLASYHLFLCLPTSIVMSVLPLPCFPLRPISLHQEEPNRKSKILVEEWSGAQHYCPLGPLLKEEGRKDSMLALWRGRLMQQIVFPCSFFISLLFSPQTCSFSFLTLFLLSFICLKTRLLHWVFSW